MIIGTILLPWVLCLPQRLPFRTYTNKDGLAGTSIQCILQDKKGYLWIGTRDGLSRFNGLEFTNFTKKDGLVDSYITSLMTDKNGDLWVCTLNSGIFKYTEQRFIRQWPIDNNGRDDKTVTFYFSCVEDHVGTLWFGTNKGVIRFDGKHFDLFTTQEGLCSNVVKQIAVDGDGTIWLATSRGLGRYVDGAFKCFTTDEGMPNNDVKTLLVDSRRRLWVGTSGGLCCFQNNTFISYTTDHGLCHNVVRSLAEDGNGHILIGTWDGVSYFDGKTFQTYSTKNGLANNFVYSITKDREGNTWFGTGGGLCRLRSFKMVSYSMDQGLPGKGINAVIQDRNGCIWIGTLNGLSCYKDGTFKNYSTADGLGSNLINFLLEDQDGKIWIATPEGISVFANGRFTTYKNQPGLDSDITFRLCNGKGGVIWIGHSRGISRYKNGTFSSLPMGTSSFAVESILEDRRGSLWFSSRVGLYRLENDVLACFTTREGLLDNVVNLLFQDSKERLWISVNGGVSCYHEGKFTNYTTENGLPHEKCNFFLEDLDGIIWMGTPGGLTCYNGNTFKTYTARQHGMVSDCWEVGTVDKHGNIWVGSAEEGLTRFQPPPVRLNKTAPPVYISKVKVMEEEIPLSRLRQLDWDHNYIHFEFDGLCYSAPESVEYMYYLEGVDKDWKRRDSRSIFYYLPHGKYKFRVKAVNNDGVESLKPAEVSFEILPAFWQTWWFKTIIGLLVLVTMGLIFLWRFIQERNKTELESRTKQLVLAQRMELMGTLASGTVHDLKNLLVVIMTISQTMGQTYDKKDDNFKNIELIEETTKTAMQMAKQILSFARFKHGQPSGDADLGYLLLEILKTLQLTAPKNVQILPQLPGKQVLLAIQPARFQQLVMNLCLNAIYAMPKGGVLTISLEHGEADQIILKISDTGTGIPPEIKENIFKPLFTTKGQDEGTGLGLFVVKQVVEEHHGTIEVQSEVGKGTTFIVCFSKKKGAPVKADGGV